MPTTWRVEPTLPQEKLCATAPRGIAVSRCRADDRFRPPWRLKAVERSREWNWAFATRPERRWLNDTTRQVIYAPPEGEGVLRSKLANWERYIHETEEIDPLIRLAVMHCQFEAIHPFSDGNGRTGACAEPALSRRQGPARRPRPLSQCRHIIRNKALYYRYLLEVTTRQNWEAWILFILETVRTTAEWTTEKIGAIRELLDQTSVAIRAETAEDLLPGTEGPDLRSPILSDQRRGQRGFRQAPDGGQVPDGPRGRGLP